MRFIVPSLTVVAVLGVAACANNPNRPTDVGSMQTPTPYRPGIVDPTARATPDVGSMQLPQASGGFQVREAPSPDTGSMALPPAAQGNSGTRRVTP